MVVKCCIVHNQLFDSKTQLKKYVVEQKKEIGVCYSLKNDYNEFYLFIIEFFKRHPEADEKMKDMVDVSIEQNLYKSLAFYIILPFGKKRDIGTDHCVNKKPPTKERLYTRALRSSIEDQIQNFKKIYAHCKICPLCKIEYKKDFHIDHKYPSFKRLQEMFDEKYNYTIPTLYDDERYTNKCIFRKEDKNIKISFQEFHKKNAKLDKICKKCNLTKSN